MDKDKECKKIISIDLEDEDDKIKEEEINGNLKADSASENGGTSSANKRNKKLPKAVKDILNCNGTKFMSDFDPELSNREKRKLSRKIVVEGKKSGTTEENGTVSNGVEKDVCDCLNESCPGCHFPCPKCRSCKCGIECRVNRKWTYDSIENESEAALQKFMQPVDVA